MTTDHRLIEDYIPIEAISAEARREKSIRKGHISTLHLWWARRPLVAARAAVYGALVPAPTDKHAAKEAADFVAALCKYPGARQTIAQARSHVLQAHAERLTTERGELVTVEDIEAERAPRPRVLDMFAGGGAIPLEALRLGCEAYALDLNPVAHLIELCTLVYPQQCRRRHLGWPGRRGGALGAVGARTSTGRNRRFVPTHPRSPTGGRSR
jgi:putative DNA methylase